MSFKVYVNEIGFTGGSSISAECGDITIFVGPNNAGKSATLRELARRLKGGGSLVSYSPVSSVRAVKDGAVQEVGEWLKTNFFITPDGTYQCSSGDASGAMHPSSLDGLWQNQSDRLAALYPFFCQSLRSDDKFSASGNTNNIGYTVQAPTHPLHYLYKSAELEKYVSQVFNDAFGLDLVVNRLSGAKVTLHVGERPSVGAGEDRLSASYAKKIDSLEQVETQGDGMRSFAGTILTILTTKAKILFIDEPEAFLHPPQAKILGKVIASEKKQDTQVFLATHSLDFIKGVLEVGEVRTHIVRLDRGEGCTEVAEIKNSNIKDTLGDTLLRQSNVLDGLFYKGVIVCESDADTEFYSSIFNLQIGEEGQLSTYDYMFCNAGGKDRVPVLLEAYARFSTPARVIVDIDFLRDPQLVKKVLEPLGGKYEEIKTDHLRFLKLVEEYKPVPVVRDVRDKVVGILDEYEGEPVNKKFIAHLTGQLKEFTPWGYIKRIGERFFKGEQLTLYKSLEAYLSRCGVFLVPVGELEGFDRTTGKHGPSWVYDVLEKYDIKEAPELEEARQFIGRVKAAF